MGGAVFTEQNQKSFLILGSVTTSNHVKIKQFLCPIWDLHTVVTHVVGDIKCLILSMFLSFWTKVTKTLFSSDGSRSTFLWCEGCNESFYLPWSAWVKNDNITMFSSTTSPLFTTFVNSKITGEILHDFQLGELQLWHHGSIVTIHTLYKQTVKPFYLSLFCNVSQSSIHCPNS